MITTAMNIETYLPLNVATFLAINATESSVHAVVILATVLAKYSPWLTLVAFGATWLFGEEQVRRATVLAGAALAVGLMVNFTITLIVYVPRPFEMGIGRTLLAHAPETSFPSDHATFLWSLGFGLLFSGEITWLAQLVIVLGGLTAWARTFLGLHFPLDMMASLFISVGSAGVARAGAPSLRNYLFPPVDWVHGRLWRAVNAVTDRCKRAAGKRSAGK